jgi:hypothetical protein
MHIVLQIELSFKFVHLVVRRLRFLGRIDPNNQTSRSGQTRRSSFPFVPRKRVILALRNVPTTFTGDAVDMKELTTWAMCPDWTFAFSMRLTRAIRHLLTPNVDTSNG